MIAPRIPANEAQRIACLHSYSVLDTSADRIFDDLTRLAANIAGTPTALISLVDTGRQWFKARVELDATETSREISLCGHVVASGDALVVTDATADERFHDNPLVTGPLQLRFYAGVPLCAPEGEVLGTVCCIDYRPRQISAQQVESLKLVANQVIAALELRRSVRELNDAHAELVKRTERKDRLTAAMTHEVRTPMNGVVGLSELLLQGELQPEQRRLVQIIEGSAKALIEVVNDVLDLNKIEAGKFELASAPVDIAHIAITVVGLLRPRAIQKKITLTLDVASGAEGAWLGDTGRIRQVMLNLVGNAVKFTSRGGVRVTLFVNASGPALTVSDTGAGIPSDRMGELFQEFSQLGPAPEGERGTGLGLWLSRRLARSMGGDVEAASTFGEGSAFLFTLPLPRATAALAAVPLAPPLAPKRVDYRVLVVDDNAVNQLVARVILEKLGCTVDLACDGEEALMCAASTPYALILMDCHMPGMDGWTATREQRARPGARVPIVGLTASAGDAERQKCLEAGMDDVLTKPVLVADFQRILERLPAIRS